MRPFIRAMLIGNEYGCDLSLTLESETDFITNNNNESNLDEENEYKEEMDGHNCDLLVMCWKWDL